MKKVLLTVMLGSSMLLANASEPLVRKCASNDLLQQQLANDPGRATAIQQIENQTAAYILAQQKNGGNSTQAIVTIPVVFHVVYNTSAQNISDAKCMAQLDQLNLDYARLNSDAGNTPSVFAGLASNTQIQFCMAQRDPSGNATTGIVHKSTTSSSFSSNDNVKRTANGGDNAWDATKYLNIWTCNLGGGLLGYAQFPGGSASTDGVVVLYSSVGSMASPGTATPYHLGRTATHEVGHWLNLYHIWGDESACNADDNVSDTPKQKAENYGCPSYPQTTQSGGRCSTSDPSSMYMNYMDYTDDGCMNMFSNGQASRMQALFVSGGSRFSIVSSLGCTPPTGGTCNVATGLSTSGITTTTATLNWAAASGATSYNVQYRVVGAGSWTSTTSTTTSKALSGLTASTNYEWQVQTVCSSGSSAFSSSSTFTTSSVASCNVATGLTTGSITSSSAALSWSAASGATSYNVQYRIIGAGSWTSTTSTTTSKSLSGLTASTNYEWQVQTVCSSGSSAFSGSATFTTLATSGCTDAYEPNESRTAAKTVSTNVHITGKIGTSTDKDYFKFTTTSPNTNIKIDLTNLPGDYDIKLLNSSGSTLVTSQNGGTTSEQIKRNTSSAATYYVYIYGYQGANSTTVCYDLLISTSSTSWRESADAISDPVAVENQMVVYPNPTTGIVNIGFNATTTGTASVRITDLVGRVIISRTVEVTEGNNKVNLDMTPYNKGIYIVEFNNENNRSVQRLMLEK